MVDATRDILFVGFYSIPNDFREMLDETCLLQFKTRWNGLV